MSVYKSVDGLNVFAEESVLRMVLSRPERRNALTDEMTVGLADAVTAAGGDEAIRVILLEAKGENFCSGADLKAKNPEGARAPSPGSIQRRLPATAHRLLPALLTVQKPVVCKVKGWAVGIGLHLVLASDFAIVATDSCLWEPFATRGFSPDSAGSWLLPRRVGDVRAREMLMLGREVSGSEAAAWGMVHGAFPATDLNREVDAIVARLATGPTVSLGLTKWLLHSGTTADLDAHLRNEAFALEISSRSNDFREGIAAFREKRDPRFDGR